MQSTEHLPVSLIDEFLFTKDISRRSFLGDVLLRQQTEFAAEKIEPLYRLAKQNQQLHPLMPSTVTEFVQYKFGNRQARHKLHWRLMGQLAFASGLKGLTIRGNQAII
jgi:hypothetical protein